MRTLKALAVLLLVTIFGANDTWAMHHAGRALQQSTGVRAFAIGDSVMEGAQSELQQHGIQVDALVSRQFVAGTAILQSLAQAGQLPDTVIVGLGTNGPFTAGQFDEMMSALRSVPSVFFITVREPRFWEAAVNDALRAGVARWPRARLIDWHAAAVAHAEWLWTDGIHLRPAGAAGYESLVAAALDGGASPAPQEGPATLAAGVCASQPATWHVPGLLLHGANLHGLAVDDVSGHAFVLANGSPGAAIGPCSTSLLTLDIHTGRFIRATNLPGSSKPTTYHALALHRKAHLLLVLTATPPAPQTGARTGTIAFIDTRTGALVKTVVVGSDPGAMVLDARAYRAFVVLHANSSRTGSAVAMIAVTRGIVLGILNRPAQKILVDQHTGRVFLISAVTLTTVDAVSGRIVNTVSLPGGPNTHMSVALDERASRLFISHNQGSVGSGQAASLRSSIAIVDAKSGALLQTLVDGPNRVAGNLIVDQRAGIVLSWRTDGQVINATELDARDGSIRGSVQLLLPPGGFQGPTVVDSRTGDIYGFTVAGLRAVRPGAWNQIRIVSTTAGKGLALVMSSQTRRIFALDRGPVSGQARDTLSGFCTTTSC